MEAVKTTNSARRRANFQCPPLTSYFTHIDEVEPCRVVIHARESTEEQDRDANLQWQRTMYRRLLRQRGFDVLKTFGEVCSGYNYWRPVLAEACAFARKHNAIVVTEAVNRFLRPDFYTPQFMNEIYDVTELEHIKAIADGAILCTILHPDMPEAEVHGHQINRGLAKPAKRGDTKARNSVAKDAVLELFVSGYSQAEIRRMTGQGTGNVARWISEQNADSKCRNGKVKSL